MNLGLRPRETLERGIAAVRSDAPWGQIQFLERDYFSLYNPYENKVADSMGNSNELQRIVEANLSPQIRLVRVAGNLPEVISIPFAAAERIERLSYNLFSQLRGA